MMNVNNLYMYKLFYNLNKWKMIKIKIQKNFPNIPELATRIVSGAVAGILSATSIYF